MTHDEFVSLSLLLTENERQCGYTICDYSVVT